MKRSVFLLRLVTIVLLFASALLFGGLLAGCGDKPDSAVDLAPFKQMAQKAEGADINNRLFLIDGRLVFWQKEGHVADASYQYTLYGSAPDQVLCKRYDTIAGPRNEVNDEQYRALFETITANLGKPDLGLGSGHTVDPVAI
jgi:hypothetical protein